MRRRKEWGWTVPRQPAWAARPHSWLQLHINSPEDELRLRYADLPKVAEECAGYGISAIQLVGWNRGGQDGGNPSHDTDPRLGTREELKKAIEDCHAFGVKVILFAKFTWTDMTTPRYRDELYRYAARDPHGLVYVHGGYQYQTPSQLCDVGTHRFAVMCFCGGLRALYRREFQKILDLGADGILYDECQHHGEAVLCFAADHGHRRGAFVYEHDNDLIAEFRAMAPEDFFFCGEADYDMEFQQYNMAYFRTYAYDEIPSKRYLRPDGNATGLMVAVPGFDDRDTLNKCLMCNYVPSYEPFFFKGRPSDFPLTMDYGRKMQALREETADYVWYGTFSEKRGAAVLDAGGCPHPHYTVFTRADGRKAVVVTNNGDRPQTFTVLPDGGTIARWRAVDGDWQEGCTVTLAPHTAAVVLEQ